MKLSGTFIFERLLGSGSYFLLVFLITTIISNSKGSKIIKITLNISIVLLCLMAFFYIPAQTADLYRWRLNTSNWPSMSLSVFYDQYFTTSNTPVGFFMIYICQKTGIKGMLPLVCTLIYHVNIFHIIKLVLKKGDYSNKTIATSFLFVMCTGRFLEVISGVRCLVAFSIIARIICDEIIDNKSIIKSFVWYFLACLIHTAAIPLVAVRFFVLVFEKKTKLWIKLMNICFVIFAIYISLVYGDLYINDAVDRANGYIANDVYSYGWEYLIVGLQLIIILRVLYLYYLKYKDDSYLKYIALVCLIFSVIVVVLFKSYSIFHRFVGFCSYIMIPLICYVDYNKSEKSIVFDRNIRLICYFIMTVAALRGNLSGYKFIII